MRGEIGVEPPEDLGQRHGAQLDGVDSLVEVEFCVGFWGGWCGVGGWRVVGCWCGLGLFIGLGGVVVVWGWCCAIGCWVDWVGVCVWSWWVESGWLLVWMGGGEGVVLVGNIVLSYWVGWTGEIWGVGVIHLVGQARVEEAAVDLEGPTDHPARPQAGLRVRAVHLFHLFCVVFVLLAWVWRGTCLFCCVVFVLFCVCRCV
jgi:hypothetical protein